MTKKPLLSLKTTPRQKVILGASAILAAAVLLLEHWTFPAFDEWRTQAAMVNGRASSYARLSSNLALKDRVEEQFSQLHREAFRTGSDEIMFSDFLKRIEAAAGPLLVKVEPSPAKDGKSYTTYRVRLLLSGKLQDIVRFADELTHGPEVTGMESFSLRAIPGRNMCECTFVLWMVRLSQGQDGRRLGSPSSKPMTIPTSKAVS